MDEQWTDQLAATLRDQHRRIKVLIRWVANTHGDQRRSAFLELRCLVAAHEAAEALAMHSCFRAVDPEDPVVSERIEEEDEAARAMTELESLDLDDTEFDDRFAEFIDAVVTHAESEEHQEIPAFVERISEDDAEEIVSVLRQADAIASAEVLRQGDASFVELVETAMTELEGLGSRAPSR